MEGTQQNGQPIIFHQSLSNRKSIFVLKSHAISSSLSISLNAGVYWRDLQLLLKGAIKKYFDKILVKCAKTSMTKYEVAIIYLNLRLNLVTQPFNKKRPWPYIPNRDIVSRFTLTSKTKICTGSELCMSVQWVTRNQQIIDEILHNLYTI